MSDISNILTKEEVHQIAEKDDFHIAPYRSDGETFGTPTWIWVVEVEGELYVRAYHGTSSRWYQSAMKQKAGKIEAAGLVRRVRFESVSGVINTEVDNAYREKYRGSPYLNSMISDRAKAATVKVVSFES